MAPFVLLLTLATSAAGLRTSSLVRRPTPQAVDQVLGEQRLLEGFRQEAPVLVGPAGSQALAEQGLLDGFRREGPAQATALVQADGVSAQASVASVLGEGGSCQMVSSGPVCLAGQQSFLLPNAVPSGLIGHWTFDEEVAWDASGNGNHGVTEVSHGPSPLGVGHSAVFKEMFITVPDSAQFHVAEYTYTFWVYFQGGASADEPDFCPLLRKGIHEDATEQYASAPSVMLDPRTGRVRVLITTAMSSGGHHDTEYVESNGRILPRRWMHIAVVRRESPRPSIDILLNGILDSTAVTHGRGVANQYPLYIGGDPLTSNKCGHTLFMDELRFYGHAVARRDIAAEAAPALGGADPSLVRLGCLGCTLQAAVQSCPQNRHVCSSLELHTGGYQVARSLGWLGSGTHVWTHSAVAGARAATQDGHNAAVGQKGLGLCCRGPPP